MSITNEQKKAYRAIAHKLKPVVTVSENGISEGVIQELNRALEDHELIKVKIAVSDREAKVEIIDELVNQTSSELVQTIGKIAVLLRRNAQPSPRLSNLLRRV